ncbi:caspase domain-containing protein [Flammula alnicola]|nr:caspase domain-containing protein [Flammula alnicola]
MLKLPAIMAKQGEPCYHRSLSLVHYPASPFPIPYPLIVADMCTFGGLSIAAKISTIGYLSSITKMPRMGHVRDVIKSHFFPLFSQPILARIRSLFLFLVKLTRGAIWGRKKALLIGVQRLREAEPEDSLVEGDMVIMPLPRGRRKKKAKVAKDVEEGAPNLGVLKGPHHDVKIMRDLLLDKYGYDPEDIIVLIDDDDPNHTQPTRSNIMFHINRLVAGSRKRDKLFFHFCGHADQEDTDDIDEEDGKNERILASDGQHIVDNELRANLVDPLPAGCSLRAVFDCCHSGSLLDLPHYRCNRVYVPWLNKGRRRTNTLWAIRTSLKHKFCYFV